eukprot:1475236-Alexandrium_andersonii.AAC.1
MNQKERLGQDSKSSVFPRKEGQPAQVIGGDWLVLLDVEKSGAAKRLALLGLKDVDPEDLVGIALRYH